jgi:hypothetical protein
VILGHLIPAGTGFEPYAKLTIRRLVEEPEYADDDQMIAEAVEEAEALGAERFDPDAPKVGASLATPEDLGMEVQGETVVADGGNDGGGK